jgi:hypothetical protein
MRRYERKKIARKYFVIGVLAGMLIMYFLIKFNV